MLLMLLMGRSPLARDTEPDSHLLERSTGRTRSDIRPSLEIHYALPSGSSFIRKQRWLRHGWLLFGSPSVREWKFCDEVFERIVQWDVSNMAFSATYWEQFSGMSEAVP
jgi:hypothetical protein